MDKSSNDKWFNARPLSDGAAEIARRSRGTPRLVVGALSDSICAFVGRTSDIFSACREAVDIARESGKTVTFQFRDHCVVVQPSDDPVAIARQWWAKEHNETPEQTLARW